MNQQPVYEYRAKGHLLFGTQTFENGQAIPEEVIAGVNALALKTLLGAEQVEYVEVLPAGGEIDRSAEEERRQFERATLRDGGSLTGEQLDAFHRGGKGPKARTQRGARGSDAPQGPETNLGQPGATGEVLDVEAARRAARVLAAVGVGTGPGAVEAGPTVTVKRKPGRPKGSGNKQSGKKGERVEARPDPLPRGGMTPLEAALEADARDNTHQYRIDITDEK